ncbi:MAG TPA: hypothetical protein VI072_20835 [Polyangiaceae bacterium]
MPRPLSVSLQRAPAPSRDRTLGAGILLLSALLLGAGCGYDNDDTHREPNQVAEAIIDVDAAFEPLEPGQGVGLFVEHGTDGRWRLFTSCDTSNPAGSGDTCVWEVWVALPEGSRVRSYQTEMLEGEDGVYWDGPGNGMFAAYTGSDLDGFSFATDAGQPVRIWAYLDGQDAHPYVNWISGGAAVQGAATNPIDLLPQAP